jgi:hypothetical protein
MRHGVMGADPKPSVSNVGQAPRLNRTIPNRNTFLSVHAAARARFWLWFVASVKFLVPFVMLGALGAWLRTSPSLLEPGLFGNMPFKT